jgi:chromosome segregation ATPase
MRSMTPQTMTPSYSAPKLRRPSYGGIHFDPAVSLDEEAQASEQREVNQGLRSTLGAVNSTLRSQGAAIRGLEELLKRALPEIDRMVKVEKLKADASSVEQVFIELVKLKDQLETIEERSRGTLSMVDGKFDATLGQRALEALQRQQQQAEHEAAAREAVAAEVVRIASSIAVFSTTVDTVRQDHKTMEPRITSLERRSDAADHDVDELKAMGERLHRGKADAALVDGLRAEVSEAAEGAQRRYAKMEDEVRKQYAELSKGLGQRMERYDCQRALDGLSEQLAKQASDHSSASARLGETLNGRVERAEQTARSALLSVEGDAAEARADLQAQLDKVGLAVDAAAASAASQLRAQAASAEREISELRTGLEAAAEKSEGVGALRVQLSSVTSELAALSASAKATQEEVESLVGSMADVRPVATRLTPLIPKMTSQLQVVTDRLETCEDRLQELFSEGGGPSAAAAAQRDREMSLMRAVEALRVRLETLESRVHEEAGSAARREAEARSAATNAHASAAAAAAAARSAALTAADAADRSRPPSALSQSISQGHRSPDPSASGYERGDAGAVHELRAEMAAMRKEQQASQQQIAALAAELHAATSSQHAPGSLPRPRGNPSSPGGSSACGGLGAGGQPPRPPTSDYPTPVAAAFTGSSLAPYDASRISDLEQSLAASVQAHRQTESAMHEWSTAHAETIEVLLSQALTGRWVGTVGGDAPTGGAAGGGLVRWLHQAANTHSDCFGWQEGTHELQVGEPGVYELGMGLWPPTPGMQAELRVDGLPAVLVGGAQASVGLPKSEGGRSPACGLCCITMLSLNAGARLSLAATSAAGPAKAYLGLRKL